MSGAVPERIAATIFVSLMSPTTLTWIFFCFALYSSTSDLNAFSSCVPALHPAQSVRFTRLDDERFEEPPQAARAKLATTSTPTVATRFMGRPGFSLWSGFLTRSAPNERSGPHEAGGACHR